jgi:hypothetical protein
LAAESGRARSGVALVGDRARGNRSRLGRWVGRSEAERAIHPSIQRAPVGGDARRHQQRPRRTSQRLLRDAGRAQGALLRRTMKILLGKMHDDEKNSDADFEESEEDEET